MAVCTLCRGEELVIGGEPYSDWWRKNPDPSIAVMRANPAVVCPRCKGSRKEPYGEPPAYLPDPFGIVVEEREVMVKCGKCQGEGRVANSDDQEPWSVWANLRPGEDMAVRVGLVRPMACPRCKGRGVEPERVDRGPHTEVRVGDLTWTEEKPPIPASVSPSSTSVRAQPRAEGNESADMLPGGHKEAFAELAEAILAVDPAAGPDTTAYTLYQGSGSYVLTKDQFERFIEGIKGNPLGGWPG